MKEFDTWNIEKKLAHNRVIKKDFIINTKEIWYVSLWCNVWYEQDGKMNFLRPVLVIRRIWSLYFCIPLTTRGKCDSAFYYTLYSVKFGKPSSLILSQWRVLDKKRFRYKINKVAAWEFNHIKKLLKGLYLWEVF